MPELIAEQLHTRHTAGSLGRYRFLATDLDGTLLDPEGRVSPGTMSALVRARDAGLRTAIVTARPMRLVSPLFSDELSAAIDVVIITNGAAIYDAKTGQLLHEDTLPVEQASQAMHRLREIWPDAVFGWETGRDFWSDREFLELWRRGGILRDPHDQRLAVQPDGGVHQVVFAVPGLDPADCVSTAAEVLSAEISVTESHGGVVELSTNGITKGNAVNTWIGMRSSAHSIADAIAFGDGHNDLSMLLAAGTGVAMANASREIQARATFVTASNHHDGVAEFVNAYLDLITEERTL